LISGRRRKSDVHRRPDELPSQRRVDPHAAPEAGPASQVLPVLPGFTVSGDFHHPTGINAMKSFSVRNLQMFVIS
jgi:hypothetical protein